MTEKEILQDAVLRYASFEAWREERRKKKIMWRMYFAAGAAACIVLFLTTPINAYIKNLVTVFYHDHISLSLTDDQQHSEIIDDVIQFGFLPEGWGIEVKGLTDNWTAVDIKNGESEIIIRKEVYSENRIHNIDNHYGEPEEININGTIYYYNEFMDQKHVIYTDDYNYIVVSYGISKELLFKIIERGK